MKRLHVHVSVDDLAESIRFYRTLFGSEPSVRQSDYAKWLLEDPSVNFAISARGRPAGLDHLGLQVESDAELREVADRLAAAEQALFEQRNAACCYARGDKAWSVDPQGVRWETFHTHEALGEFGVDTATAEEESRPTRAACCAAEGAPEKAACC